MVVGEVYDCFQPAAAAVAAAAAAAEDEAEEAHMHSVVIDMDAPSAPPLSVVVLESEQSIAASDAPKMPPPAGAQETFVPPLQEISQGFSPPAMTLPRRREGATTALDGLDDGGGRQGGTKDDERQDGRKETTDRVPHIPFSQLDVGQRPVAAGSFKSTYKARWAKKGCNVALLVIRNSDKASLADLEKEIRMFSTLGKHRHLAQLLATCTHPDSGDKCMVLEFAELGSLDHVLKKASEDDAEVSNAVSTAICLQVAEGMAHLHLYNIIHRDVAARNILVFLFDTQDWKRVLVKVTDYGLSLLADNGGTLGGGSSVMEVATAGTSAAVPARYWSPEALKKRSHSKKGDVWSIGVLMYEVFTLGDIPYYAIAEDREVVKAVLAGELQSS